MMQPVLEKEIPFKLNRLCKLAGMEDMRQLPQCRNNCFRWMLGLCEPTAADATKCKQRPGNKHPTAAETPDDYAAQMARLLQSGVDKLLGEAGVKRQRA